MEQIQGVRVSVDTNEIANAAYQVWLFHTSFADGIAVVCQEKVFPRCRICCFCMQVHVRNLHRSTDVLRCSSESCVEFVWQSCCVFAWSQCFRLPHGFSCVFSHRWSQLVLSKFPTVKFFAGPIMKATFVLAASVCGGRSSWDSHQWTVEPRSAGVHVA